MPFPPATSAGGGPSGPTVPELAIVAAVAANGVIGAGGDLPWRLRHDLRHFRELTQGHAVIMGRRTWESLKGPLAGRQNIVVTSRRDYAAPGAAVAAGLDEALAIVAMPPPAFCIGGGELYRDALARAQTLHLTEIARPFEGDVRFPAVEPADWREVGREEHLSDEGYAYAFVTYERERSRRT